MRHARCKPIVHLPIGSSFPIRQTNERTAIWFLQTIKQETIPVRMVSCFSNAFPIPLRNQLLACSLQMDNTRKRSNTETPQALEKKNIPVPRTALECRENVLRISAWRIKQGHLPLWPQAAQSQQLKGLQGIRTFMSGSTQTDLLPTCCLRTAAQGYAGQQAGSL